MSSLNFREASFFISFVMAEYEAKKEAKKAERKKEFKIEWQDPIGFDDSTLPPFPVQVFPILLRNYVEGNNSYQYQKPLSIKI